MNQLLLLHSDLRQPENKIRENWYLAEGAAIISSAHRLEGIWKNKDWGGEPVPDGDYASCLGQAMEGFLLSDMELLEGQRLLTKTPSCLNIQFFHELFPHSRPIVILRDPRDVALSAEGTWSRPWQVTMKDWQVSAEHLRKLEESVEPESFHIIRYEDLVQQPAGVMKELLGYLDLDEKSYDFESIDELPVFSSSESKGWGAKERTDDFDPFQRWKRLDDEQQRLITGLCPGIMTAYGYGESLQPMPAHKERLSIYAGLPSPNTSDPSGLNRLKSGLKRLFNRS